MSFRDFKDAATNEDGLKALILLVEQWPGLAMLAQAKETVVAASQKWEEIGIPPEELRVHGWQKFVWEGDLAQTEEVAEMSSGDAAVAVARFRNRYLAEDGRLSLLEWDATPFDQLHGMTLSLAKVLQISTVDTWMHEESAKAQRRRQDIEDFINSRSREKWRSTFRDESPAVVRWAASLTGEVLFSEGGPDMVGLHLGKDFGGNPEFFRAVKVLTQGSNPDSLVQHAVGKPDNPISAGKTYVNAYSLLRYASGRPYGVAVTTIDTTGGEIEPQYISALLGD